MVNSPDGESSRRSFLTNAGLGASAAALLAGLNQGAQAQKADPVIVGCPMPLTGVVAADGIEFRRGIEMSAKEINALGGILGRPIELRFADTESKGDDVITAAGQRLIDKLVAEGRLREVTEIAVEGWLAFVRAACVKWIQSPNISRADLTEMCLRAFDCALGHPNKLLASPNVRNMRSRLIALLPRR